MLFIIWHISKALIYMYTVTHMLAHVHASTHNYSVHFHKCAEREHGEREYGEREHGKRERA